MSESQGSYPAPPAPPPRSSSNTWVWIIVLVLILPFLACAGLCTGLFLVRSTTIEHVQEAATEAMREGARAAPPFRIALERIQADPDVKERLGEPIEEGIPTVFTYQDGTHSSNAEFRYPISSPEGTANVHVAGKWVDGEWWFETLDVTFADGETISLADVDVPIQIE